MGDSRPQSGPASSRRVDGAARGARQAPPASGAERDLQSVVTRALERLLEDSGCACGAVWWRDAEGAPAVLAARGPVAELDEETFDALLTLEAPRDLGERNLPAPLARLARETGLAAAAPIAQGGTPLAALLLGGDQDPPGAVRPRTLAALGAAAVRLAVPFGASRGAARLAALDAGVERLDRLSALGELVAEIVHEIRNPLVSVKTFLQLLPERADDVEFREQFHAVATDELRRVERLLDLILAHGRPPENERPGRGSSVAAAFDAVGTLVGHRAAQAGAEIDAPHPAAALRTALPEDALRQVLLNLTLNAIDATPPGGAVRLRARRGGGGVEIRVEDDGEGIPTELHDRVFTPFFSTRPGRPGGLGLAISRRLAERAGGRLEIMPGGGGCFRLWLPEAQENAASQSET